ncbi:MAG: TonB-dependent receptor [Novosphingobium sp.]|nr:TonB-dependent receptor [Novosphingobium sp.]
MTATKRSENIQKVPIAINVLSGDTLTSKGIAQTSELAAQVPNLQISSSFGKNQPNFILRGISVGNEFNSNQASPIGVYLDEDYLSARFAQGMNLFDLERVEVVKGPQGTLYGRNTVGGAINIVTKKAGFGPANGYVTAGYGNFNRYSAAAAFGTTLIDDVLAIRVAGTFNRGDGEEPNPLPGKPAGRSTRDYAVRASILFKPADNLSFTLRGYKGKSNPTSEAGYSIGAGPGGANAVTGYMRPANYGFYETAADYVGRNAASAQGLGLIGKLELSSFEITSITAYDDGKLRIDQDPDGSPVDEFSINWYANYKQFNQDLRLSSDASRPLRFIVGGYYGFDRNKTFNTYRFFNFLQYVPGTPAFDPPNIFVPPPYPGLIGGVPGVFSGFGVHHDFTQDRRSYAGYGEVDWDVSDKITLTAGLRYTHDTIRLYNVSSTAFAYNGIEQFTLIPLLNAPGTSCPGTAGCPDKLTNSSSKVTGRAIINYKPTPNLMLYASYSRGYRAGAINGTAYASPGQLTFVEPEQLTAYEAGFKSTLLDRRIRFNGAVFYYDYRNQQLQEVIGIVPFLRNAPKARAIGLDLDFSARISDAVTLNLGYGYLDSKYQTLVLSGVNLAGNRFSNAPNMTFNASADIKLLDNGTGQLHLLPNAVFTGDTWFSPFNRSPSSATGAVGDNRYEYQAGYWLANIRAEFVMQRLSVGVYAKNLFDQRYFTAAVDLRAAIGADYLVRGDRRKFGFDVTYRF